MKKEIKIALVAIVALIVIYFGLEFLKGAQVFANRDVYYLAFHDVAGVTENCAIYANGVSVGTVTGITYDYSHAEPTKIAISVAKKMVIPEGSQAEIKTDLMGNTQINLLLADYNNAPLPVGGTIYGKEDGGLLGQAAAMLPTIEQMLPKVDSILYTINTLLADPAVKAIIYNAEQITNQLTTSAAQLNRLLAEVNSTMPAMLGNANALIEHTDTLSQHLAELDLSGMMTTVNSTLASVQSTIDELSNAEGTIGKLLNDSQLYDNLAATMADADSLVVDLKEHPKRYVHFSLFGKKDK